MADNRRVQRQQEETAFFKALRNLVQNALESHLQARDSAADRPEPIISLRTRLSGDHFHVEVADNGPGIAEDSLAKIFDAFYTTKFTGTGLGLMVTDEIARAHHGRVSVESPPGAGARFILTLPLAERPIRLLEAPVAEPAADPS